MKKVFLVVGCVIVLSVLGGCAYYVSQAKGLPSPTPSPTPSEEVRVGGDRDIHGCIASAGYSWCEEKKKCLRTWEEPCTSALPSLAADESSSLIPIIKQALVAKHGNTANELNITVSQIQGTYAKGMASATGGGGLWFAAKVNGNWTLVWDGNGIIECATVKGYPEFPKAMIPSCFDTVKNDIVTR